MCHVTFLTQLCYKFWRKKGYTCELNYALKEYALKTVIFGNEINEVKKSAKKVSLFVKCPLTEKSSSAVASLYIGLEVVSCHYELDLDLETRRSLWGQFD